MTSGEGEVAVDDALNSPDRARQFLPFAALTGFERFIAAEERADEAAYASPRAFRATGFAEAEVDIAPARPASPGACGDSHGFREIRQSRPWDLRSARILFHERKRYEECGYGRSDCEEEL